MYVHIYNYIKISKTVNSGCTETLVPFTNIEDSIQELGFSRSVCMAATYML